MADLNELGGGVMCLLQYSMALREDLGVDGSSHQDLQELGYE